jgi:hypothetical protein
LCVTGEEPICHFVSYAGAAAAAAAWLSPVLLQSKEDVGFAHGNFADQLQAVLVDFASFLLIGQKLPRNIGRGHINAS